MSFEGVIEIVESAEKGPKIRVCPTGGPPGEFFLDGVLKPPFHSAFGHEPGRPKYLRERLLQLLLLLLLSRSDPDRVRKLGYGPTTTGQLSLYEVGRLSSWAGFYRGAARDSILLGRLGQVIKMSFPDKRASIVRLGGTAPRRVWIDLDVSAIRYVGGAREAALEYIEQSTVHAVAPGDVGGAKELFDEGIRILRNTGEKTWLPVCLLMRAWFLAESDLPGARSDVEEALCIAISGGLRLMECVARLVEARVAIGEGDVEAARRAADLGRALLQRTGFARRAGRLELLVSLLSHLQASADIDARSGSVSSDARAESAPRCR